MTTRQLDEEAVFHVARRMDDPELRTDYLGVLLYELLTGETPLDRERIRNAQLLDKLRMIREEEPPRPSTRISSLGERAAATAAYRKVKPETLESEIRGDLDWIVMKALAKERPRRYDSASKLAEEIQRFLSDELVEARPPSTWYQLQKFYMRNKVLVSSIVATMAALGLGLAIALWGVARAQKANTALVAKQRTLDEKQRNLDSSVFALGEAAMELALQHALNGNRQETNSALLVAKNAKVDENRIAVIKACLELYVEGGRYEYAMNTLEQLLEHNLAARALYTNTILWSGEAALERHYEQLEELQRAIPSVLEGKTIDLEARVFLGHAAGRLDPAIAIEILRPAVNETKSPVARLLLSQALTDHADDTGDAESAVEAYRHASAAHLSLPHSSVANALGIWACHLAWRLNGDGQGDWYLAEARRFARAIDGSSTAVERLTEGVFLAEDKANPEHKTNDWDMVHGGKAVFNAAARILRHSPADYQSLVDTLKSQTPGDRWYSATNSLQMLNALSDKRHDAARTQVEQLDRGRNVLFPADPRVYALMAALIMDGRDSAMVKTLAAALREGTVECYTQPIGFVEYVLGELPEEAFIAENQQTKSRCCHAELFVALSYLGDRKREAALVHLDNSVKADCLVGVYWWALAIRDLVRNNDPLLDWLQ